MVVTPLSRPEGGEQSLPFPRLHSLEKRTDFRGLSGTPAEASTEAIVRVDWFVRDKVLALARLPANRESFKSRHHRSTACGPIFCLGAGLSVNQHAAGLTVTTARRACLWRRSSTPEPNRCGSFGASSGFLVGARRFRETGSSSQAPTERACSRRHWKANSPASPSRTSSKEPPFSCLQRSSSWRNCSSTRASRFISSAVGGRASFCITERASLGIHARSRRSRSFFRHRATFKLSRVSFAGTPREKSVLTLATPWGVSISTSCRSRVVSDRSRVVSKCSRVAEFSMMEGHEQKNTKGKAKGNEKM
eukprot:RCo041781